MNPAFYIGLTLALYAVEIYLAIVVQDIGDIFGFIGTIGGTSLSFFIPSVLYFRACDKFGKNESKTLYNFAIINFLMGIIFFGLLLFSNILSLKKD
jgi:amino acid permease